MELDLKAKFKAKLDLKQNRPLELGHVITFSTK